MASLFGLGRKKESETAENEVRNEARNVTSGAGTGSGRLLATVHVFIQCCAASV